MSKTRRVIKGRSHLAPTAVGSSPGRRMLSAFSPQALCNGERINLVLLPPQSLIAGCVVLLMVNGAERNREFVAHFEASLWIGETDLMGVAR